MSAAHGASRGADAGLRWAMHRRLEREIRRLRAHGTEVVRFEPSAATLAVMGLNAMAEDRSAEVAEAARARCRRPCRVDAHRAPAARRSPRPASRAA